VVTDPATSLEEDLALLEEIRVLSPGVRAILLAPSGTPEEIIAALRARVFFCKCAPFDPREIATYVALGIEASNSPLGIDVLSAHRNWISVRLNCHMLTAERLVSFLRELQTELPEVPRVELMMAFREILLNAVEHGGQLNPSNVVEVGAVHTARAIVFYVRDPGTGFRWDEIPHSAVSNPPGEMGHVEIREHAGMRPGGYGLLVAKGIVDELIFSEVGNEVLLIKYTA
jgi:anti-sigma regulatory factor (Ser/Thr protein kinase)